MARARVKVYNLSSRARDQADRAVFNADATLTAHDGKASVAGGGPAAVHKERTADTQPTLSCRGAWLTLS